MIEQIFLTISVDPIDQESLYLKIWRAVLESVRNNSNQNYKKAMLASTITPFTTENTSVNDIKCNIQLVNTLKLPFTTGSEAPQTTCRVLSVQSSGDILLTINNLMYFFRYTALINKSLYIRQNLLNSTNQRFGNIVTPVKLKNVIRCREWNKDELKKMNGTYLSLICNIRVTADFPSDENKTSEKNEILSKLKERDSDLDKILRKKYVEHRIKPSHITSQQGQQIAFNNYYEKILSKHSLSVPPHSKELDPDDDEEIVLLKEQLMITEQTHLQIECEAAVKHKPTNVKCKHSKQSKVARKRQTSPDINPNNYIEKLPDTIKLTSPRADSDICILPIQRPNGFFPKTVLHESGRSKYGWAPNSLLLGKYCSKLSQSETYDTKKTAKINWEEIEARLANSGFINKMEKDTSEDTMTSDFSTGWIVESDKELTMTSKELSEVDDMEKNMKEKLLASKFLNESSSDQHISLLDLQDQMNTELKQIQLADAEKILLSSDKWKVITRNELKQAEHSRQKEKDLLSNLIDRPPLHRPQYERENTIFLTEFRNSVSPDTFSAFVLPVFLERFKTSRWLPALGLLNNHIPEGWMDFNASSHPICFIQWMLWTNILPSICSQNVPPCMEDEDPYLCQTISELCYDMELLHTDFQLPEECINELHLCLTKCIVYNLENNDEFRGWKMLEAISKTLVAFGFHDIDTVVILLLLYVKVLLTTEKGDTHYPQEFTNNNLLLYIHTSLQSSGFKSKYYNYLEEELSLLNKLGKCTKPIMSGKILHISDCIHLVSNTDTLGYWIKVFKILYFWLENWYEISDGNLLKDKSPRYAKQTKSILLAAVQPRTVKKGVHWTKSDSDNNENPILKDGIKALNAFIDWCHQQKLSELREQAKEQAIKSTTMKPETDSVSKQRIQILQDGEESGKHKMVMLLPPLSEIDRCVVRLGESHVVERRKYRRMKNILQPWIKTAEQSSYQDIMSVSQSLRDPTQPSYAQPWRSYKNALTGHFPPKIHIKPTECNLLPFNKYQSFKEKLEHKLKEIETLRVKLTNMKKRNRFKKSIPYTVCNMDNEDLQNYQRFLTASIHDEEKELNTVVQLFIPILSRLLPIPMKQFSLPVIHLSHTNFKSLVSKAQYLTNYEEENQGDRHHDFDTNSAYLSGGLSAGLMSAT
uniref:Uncharacterized protein n=1 Tax=Trichobilharzia regenti TaxID=157069 RepID=A0AA85KEV5_TRIRE|nr:unnamed protein product [Trichobilharzia regenti]